tara:strand:+ start:445 stop:1200 length:756 start_codon:yes stop_codon:yes gene_type:complete
MNDLQQAQAIDTCIDTTAKRKKNTGLWRAVSVTDQAYTKKVNQRGGYTAIDPMYQARMATEQFGPFGTGWGFKESTLDASLVEMTGMVIHKALFFYILNGVRGEFPIHNAISIWSDAKKTRLDEDFAKKVETNTLSKALSKLGFCSDVFMGKFDDQRYLAYAADVVAADNDAKEADDKADAKHDYSLWIEKELDAIRNAGSAREATSIGKGLKPRASAKGFMLGYDAKKLADRIDDIVKTRIDDLSNTPQG